MDQSVPVVDIATDQYVGYLSSRYLHTKARANLPFFGAGRYWKILRIASNEIVYALHSGLTKSSILGLRQYPKSPSESHDAEELGEAGGLPTSGTKQIIAEFFENYLIIHTHRGDSVNSSLSLIFDATLTEQDLIRDIYYDPTMVLIQLSIKPTRDDRDSIIADLFELQPAEIAKYFQASLEARFPKFESERIESQTANRLAATKRQKFTSTLNFEGAASFFKEISRGNLGIQTRFTHSGATHIAEQGIKDYKERVSKEVQSATQRNQRRLRTALMKTTVGLLCLRCRNAHRPVKIIDLEARPSCKKCGSRLLAVANAHTKQIATLLRRKEAGKKVSNLEARRLADSRRTADLILSYGKPAVIALSVTGIGPQTASNILSKMGSNQASLYTDLLKAKIQYLSTRDFWSQEKEKSGSRGVYG